MKSKIKQKLWRLLGSLLIASSNTTLIFAEDLNWPKHGLDAQESRFSPIRQIHAENVSELGLAWAKKLSTIRGIEATPLVIDGTLYYSLPWSVVQATDGISGATLWTWNPGVDKAVWGRKACCDVVNRGVAHAGEHIFASTLDGRLVCLKASDGTQVWSTNTLPKDGDYSITGAPRIIGNNVIIGNGGAEYGVRGYVTAYDLKTGEQRWRFYTVPGNPEEGFESESMAKAAETWSGEWWEFGGGGTCWDAFAYDEELNLVYVGTGNASAWPRTWRNPDTGWGDNLYVSCILALDAETGELKWHYQTTPGDNWDYTAVQQMILTTLEIEGKERQVLMQAPKNGFFYVLDRATGELISAEPYTEVNWAAGIDQSTGRPIETPNADYSREPKDIKPGPLGGHNWQAMSYHPGYRLVYIPTIETGMIYRERDRHGLRPGKWNVGVNFDNPASQSNTDYSGSLLAWDPVRQRAAWKIAHPNVYNGGTLATAGDLVFQGNGEAEFVAYHAGTGQVLWRYFTGTAIIAPPVTYSIKGVQYVAVLAGWGGAYGLDSPPSGKAQEYFQEGILYTFKLEGQGAAPRLTKLQREIPDLKSAGFGVDIESANKGRNLYFDNCVFCHGSVDGQGGALPDLATTSVAYHKLWPQLVLEGILARSKGMPAFKGFITDEESSAIQHYIIQETQKLYDEQSQ
ncbi:MAG TPA: PQQ-dependent dehydrogenase, methanol/ethanol family [Verrucomicrobiales bacterium]|nr:PQQ-dependent dehydrogenase, methanol/ethanol family [Verrucomicrobiales bacterium]HCP38526.1 PQQ-dependent dehydrogenase, methanol/ethanol family [Verrucomicrobiales bacterium]|tara:strand:- start:624 stop:2678 length:2055 start_codon:yes stop_codon:yes gene_type:complete